MKGRAKVDTGLRQLYGKIPLTAQTRELFDPGRYAVFTIVSGPDKPLIGFAPVDYPEPVADACARLAPGTRIRDHEPYMTCSFSARKETSRPVTAGRPQPAELRKGHLSPVCSPRPREECG
ncbi:hypothetical protein [Actinosynnema sp. ALI-1.44]|uniref:hypothetical protein n=1 Tax=Actinosynnema sp. ALI-1.44 TaxID=1933779 RepID=UPI001873C395|nr:hypothetical protein [Actinosynnema sp. ALI-1.44]